MSSLGVSALAGVTVRYEETIWNHESASLLTLTKTVSPGGIISQLQVGFSSASRPPS